jgi:hypothetical protein
MNMEGVSFTGEFERKMLFCFNHGCIKRRLWKGVSLSIGARLGKLEWLFYHGLRKTDDVEL